MPLVTISLDYKTHAIWMRMPGNKSAWVRQMIALHAVNDLQLIEHLATPHQEWGCWPDDARCNPGLERGYCVACWTPIEVQEMQRFSSKMDYVKARRLMPHPRPEEHQKRIEDKDLPREKDIDKSFKNRVPD